MNPKYIRLYIRDKSYFIVDQYQNDLCCYDEDAYYYYYYDIDVDRISFKKNDNEYFIRYNHSNKTDIVILQLKIKNFYDKIHDYNDDDKQMIYIENSHKGFFVKVRKIWNKITKITDY